jgi:2,4-didehydro-3-deoxy-L-rhamnonate hydrolase
VRLANLDGRATIVVDGRAIDVERSSNGAVDHDPMLLSDLSTHPQLRAIASAANPADWPAVDERKLRAPVPRPPKGLGVALNYRSHAEESGRALPDEPHLFGKLENCVAGPYDPIVVPRGRDMVDYETEVVIVFGRVAKAVSEADAWSCIAGITGGRDISDRAEQFRPPVNQFTIAKTYDTFGPIGPYLVTTDEFPDVDAIGLVGRIDADEVQRGNTNDLIFSVPALVAWLTRFMTFLPGDLVWTGTPDGVGQARTPPLFLKPGMVVETEIDVVGTMRNPVVDG